MIIPNDEVIEDLIGFLVNPIKKKLKQDENNYILIYDPICFFKEINTQKTHIFQSIDFIVRTINYKNELEIEDDEIFDDLIEIPNLILFFNKGIKFIEDRFEIFKEDTYYINFSVLVCINSIFQYKMNIDIDRGNQTYTQDFLVEEVFSEFYEALLDFKQTNELKELINIKTQIYFNILLLFFGKRLFSSSYFIFILKKLKSDSSRYFFDIIYPEKLIEMLFYLKPDYNISLLNLIFRYLPESKNKAFNSVLEIIKKIFNSKIHHQSLLKHIFIFNLFRLTCGRSSFCLGESDLILFNYYSDNALSSVFTPATFCIFSDYYIKMWQNNEFKHYLKLRYLKDFETRFKDRNQNFRKEYIDSIKKEDIYNIDAQLFLFEETYNEWKKKFCENIFDDIVDNIIKKIENNNYFFDDINQKIDYYKINIYLMENFYYFKKSEKDIFYNLLKIIEKELEIFNHLNNNEELKLEFWLKSDIVESIYDIEKDFRTLKDYFVDLDHENPIYIILKERMNNTKTTFLFIDFFSNIYLKRFYNSVHSNYQELIELDSREHIKFTRDLLKVIKEDLDKEERIFFIIADCLRLDFWRSILKNLSYELNLNIEKNEKIFSLIPSTTSLSRTSIFFPEIIDSAPTLKQIEINVKEVLNIEEVKIIKLKRIKDIPSAEIQNEIDLNSKINIIISSYPDHRIHQIEDVNELYLERSYNQIKNQIKDHLYSIFNAIINSVKKSSKKSNYKIILSTDHGFIDYYNQIQINTYEMDNGLDIKSRYIRYKTNSNENTYMNQGFSLNYEPDTIYITTFGRNFFESQEQKTRNRINHGGISYYENILPLSYISKNEIKHSLYKPRLIFKKEAMDFFKGTTNQLTFSISNEDSILPIYIKSVSINIDQGLNKFDYNFPQEEGTLLPNSFSKNYNLQFEDNRDNFKLFYKIVYSYYSDDEQQLKTEKTEGDEELEQFSFHSPQVKIKHLNSVELIQGKNYDFQLKVYNPNDIQISQLRINLRLESNDEFNCFDDKGKRYEDNQIKIENLKNFEKSEKQISVVFKKRCKTDILCDGKFTLPNSQTTRFKGKNKYSVDVFESENSLNLERSFKIN